MKLILFLAIVLSISNPLNGADGLKAHNSDSLLSFLGIRRQRQQQRQRNLTKHNDSSANFSFFPHRWRDVTEEETETNHLGTQKCIGNEERTSGGERERERPTEEQKKPTQTYHSLNKKIRSSSLVPRPKRTHERSFPNNSNKKEQVKKSERMEPSNHTRVSESSSSSSSNPYSASSIHSSHAAAATTTATTTTTTTAPIGGDSVTSHTKPDIPLVVNDPYLTSIGISTGAAAARHIPYERLGTWTLSGIQLGIAFFLGRALWKAVLDVMEELDQSSGAVREDHDLPFLSEESIDLATTGLELENQVVEGKEVSHVKDASGPDARLAKRRSSEGSDANANANATVNKNHPSNKPTDRKGTINLSTISRRNDSTTNLALRLHSSGLPLSSTDGSSQPKNVQSILKSLTRTEGQLLNNILLSPLDTNENGVISGSPDRSVRVTELWNEIGGLGDVKESLLDLVFPMMMIPQQMNTNTNPSNPSKLQNVNGGEVKEDKPSSRSYYGGLLGNPPGVLLYGPPGCGKTMLVRALAHTANARFLCVTPSTLLRKYVGETNLNVRALFSLAKKISPCIIFIDEMEGLFKERGGGGGEEHEVNRELKTEFMQLWDGIQSNDEHALIVGATNRPFDVDSAFLRRMPRSFFVGLPDVNSRIAILKSMLANVPLAHDFDINAIAHVTDGYSPSDLKEVLRTAALIPLREARTSAIQKRMEARETGLVEDGIPPLRPLTTNDVMKGRAKVSPTQMSHQYRNALAEYAVRATGGRAGGNTKDDHFSSSWYDDSSNPTQNGQEVNQYGNVRDYGDGPFIADVGTFSPDGFNPKSHFYEASSDYDDYSTYDDE